MTRNDLWKIICFVLNSQIILFYLVSCDSLTLTASGAAGLNFEGYATELRLIGSGAARINAAMAPARDVSVSLSGAAKCDVDVRESLDANLSGASSCRYHAADAVRVTTHAVSRGASLTRY